MDTIGLSGDSIRVVHDCYSPNYKYEKAGQTPCSSGGRGVLILGTAPNKNLARCALALEGLDCSVELIGVPSLSDRQAFERARVPVKILGNISDSEVHQAYIRCDLVLFPSLHEGFGMPIVEAQAIGRPVVTSDCSSMPEIGGDGAAYVNPLDPQSIRDAVGGVLANRDYRENLVLCGLKNAKRFQPSRIASEFAEIYRELAGSAPRVVCPCKKKRSLQITALSSPEEGGLYVSTGQFRAALEMRGDHSIVNIVSEAQKEIGAEGVVVTVKKASSKILTSYGYISREDRMVIRDAIKKADVVIIHVAFMYHSQWAAGVCRRIGKPYLFVPHGSFDPYVFSYRRVRKWIWRLLVGRRLVRGAFATIYSTEAERVKARLTMGTHRSAVIPWAVEIPAERNRLACRDRVANLLNISPRKKILIYFARLHSMKRPLETISAFKAVIADDWLLVIAGPDGDISKSQIAEFAEGDARVRVVGGVFGEFKEVLLNAAEGLVLFSHRENFGFSVMEMLARGSPVLISEEIDIAREIQEAGVGWVVNGRREEDRIEGLRRFIGASSAERMNKGKLGRGWVQENFGFLKFQERLDALVSQCGR